MIVPNMNRIEVMQQLYKIAPQLIQKGLAKETHLRKKPMRKIPKNLRD
ncbi:MAG: hypothetical protein ACK5WF_01990 [Cyclobacteriaceae bacterium]|jgi:hypothetical protein